VDLTSPSTLLEAWVLVPALVVAASAALGLLLARVTATDLGALTLPAGFLAGVAVTSVLLSLGLSGKLSVAAVAALAVAGVLLAVLDVRRRGGLPPIGAAAIWPAAAFVLAYGIALAPIVGSGHSGMLGYQMYDDPAVHITLVENIAQHNARVDHPFQDSFHAATRDLEAGYPLGSYAWPLFGRVVTGADVFNLWVPLGAVVLAMMALVAYAILRTLTMPRAFAAAGGTLVGVGYLVYAYHAQGAMKEVLMPLAVYGAVALAARALERPAGRWSLIPAAVAATAAIADLGAGGLAWIAPVALAVAGILVWRARRARSYAPLAPLAAPAALGILLGLPIALRTVSFFRASSGRIGNPREFANLFGAVPFREAFNIWLAHDYRLSVADAGSLSELGVWFAGAFCVLGGAWALRRRDFAIPLALLAGFAAVVIITPQSSIYYDAKTYVAVAPALGLATVAGVYGLYRGGRIRRVLGLAAAALLAIGVVTSDAYVYEGAWVTPQFRFEELAHVADRTRGQGPLLVNDFEEWAPYILRDSRPWVEKGLRSPFKLFRYPGNHEPVRPLDLDDYQPQHLETFPLILERKTPYGSRPPANYTQVFETDRYRLWRRAGRAPRMHVAFGTDGAVGTFPLTCRSGVPRGAETRALFAAARRLHASVRAAVGPSPPIVAVVPKSWVSYRVVPLFKPAAFISMIGGSGSGVVDAAPGRYYVWIAGSMGPGVAVWQRSVGQPSYGWVGYASNDMGLPALWQPVGVTELHGRTMVHVSWTRRPWWKASSRHPNVIGPLVFTRADDRARIVDVPASRASSLCGKRLDWLELPPA
jgi:hypothetical protein